MTLETGERLVVDVTDAYTREELGKIDVKSFLGNVCFYYALLGESDAAAEERLNPHDVKDAFNREAVRHENEIAGIVHDRPA